MGKSRSKWELCNRNGIVLCVKTSKTVTKTLCMNLHNVSIVRHYILLDSGEWKLTEEFSVRDFLANT